VLMPSSVSATRTRLIWTCRLLAGLLILAAALARLGYLAYLSPLDLAPDEAHYWDWSRHLDWSYYSKGPLVAWLIRLSCELVGHWAEQHTGSLTFAVRLPAVICGSLLLVSLYVLVLQIFAKEPLALGVVAGGLCFPLVTAGSSLMTIDSPYACCWGWALVLGHRAVWRDSLWAWLATGVLVGLGMLAKYTMVIWLPSLGLFPQLAGPADLPGGAVWLVAGLLVCRLAGRHVDSPAHGRDRSRPPLPVVVVGPDVPPLPRLQSQDGWGRGKLAGDGLHLRVGSRRRLALQAVAIPPPPLAAEPAGGHGLHPPDWPGPVPWSALLFRSLAAPCPPGGPSGARP
jgi:hypothetical protein